MTATLPARADVRYRGVIYGIDVLDHETRQVMPNDYVGKTRQRGRARENQHRDKQPFSDLIVGSPHVLWEGICTEDELDEWERHFIQDVEVRPRLNELLNEDNPYMIPKEVQRVQRWQRDDELGRQRWQPFDQRQRSSLLEWDMRQSTPIVPDRRVSVPRKWEPWQVKLVLWSTSWATSSLIVWAVLARNDWPPSPPCQGLCAAVVCLVALLSALWLTPQRRRRIAKAWRRIARWIK